MKNRQADCIFTSPENSEHQSRLNNAATLPPFDYRRRRASSGCVGCGQGHSVCGLCVVNSCGARRFCDSFKHT